MKRIITLVASILCVMSFNATAGDFSPNEYQRTQAMQAQGVESGIVLNVRNVVIQGQTSGMQYAAIGVGSATGAAIAQRVANPNVRMIATIFATAAGGAAGNYIAVTAARQAAQELIVKLDNGRIIAITQEADGNLHAGQRIHLIGNSRVVSAI